MELVVVAYTGQGLELPIRGQTNEIRYFSEPLRRSELVPAIIIRKSRTSPLCLLWLLACLLCSLCSAMH